jgi:hypothetical protein
LLARILAQHTDCALDLANGIFNLRNHKTRRVASLLLYDDRFVY